MKLNFKKNEILVEDIWTGVKEEGFAEKSDMVVGTIVIQGERCVDYKVGEKILFKKVEPFSKAFAWEGKKYIMMEESKIICGIDDRK